MGNREIKILQHRVEYSYRDEYEGEISESDVDHIKGMIDEGYREGELCTFNDAEETHYGWWKIVS
jgi:hypothetical protein